MPTPPNQPPTGFSFPQPNGSASLGMDFNSGHVYVPPPSGWIFNLTGPSAATGMNGIWNPNPTSYLFPTNVYATGAGAWTLTAYLNGTDPTQQATCQWTQATNTVMFSCQGQSCSVVLSAPQAATMGTCQQVGNQLNIMNPPASGGTTYGTNIFAPGWAFGIVGSNGWFGANFQWLNGSSPVMNAPVILGPPETVALCATFNGVPTSCTWTDNGNGTGTVTFSGGPSNTTQSFSFNLTMSEMPGSPVTIKTVQIPDGSAQLSVQIGAAPPQQAGSSVTIPAPAYWVLMVVASGSDTGDWTVSNAWSVIGGTQLGANASLPVSAGNWFLTAYFNGVPQGIAAPTWNGDTGSIVIGGGTNAITTNIICSSGGG